MAAKKRFHVRIEAGDPESLQALPMDRMDTACMGGRRRRDDGTIVFEAIVPEELMQEIGKRATVEVIADVDERGRERQKEVGRGNRFKGDDWIPRGLGKKVRR
ncbi:MAG: hypothetical protein M3273_03370 [Actinomycetota bacterium]|nr:hypothetical protein [Actinomycetota bacterium]